RLLLGVKRTCVAALHESAFDPSGHEESAPTTRSRFPGQQCTVWAEYPRGPRRGRPHQRRSSRFRHHSYWLFAGRFEALGPGSAAALNRFVFYFALPVALFVITARVPIDRIFNWPFIGAFLGGVLLTLLIAVIVGRFWFQHRDVATLSMVGL